MSLDVDLNSKLKRLMNEDGTELGILHWCPGCKDAHMINIEKPNHNNAIWTWNKDINNPTFHPSINRVGYCHYFITNGKIQFLPDCKHKLAGQTVDLPDFPEDW